MHFEQRRVQRAEDRAEEGGVLHVKRQRRMHANGREEASR